MGRIQLFKKRFSKDTPSVKEEKEPLKEEVKEEVKEPIKETEPLKQEKKEEKKEEPPKGYKVFGSDISIVEPEFIDYYKTRMKIMAIKYKLVGRVDASGKYIIPDEIKFDLVNMEKEIEENEESYYKAIALYMKKYFYFRIKIESIDGGMAKASLYLSEFVDDFLGEEYIVSHVADFVDTNDDDFRVKVRKAFHLVDATVKNDDTAIPNLAVVMQDAFDQILVVGGLYDMASQIYIMRMIALLEESGEVGKKIVARYRKLIAGKDIEINEKYRYTRYKALLDRAIDEFGGLEKLGLNKNKVLEIIKEINGVVRAIENASSKSTMMETETPTKPKAETVAKKSSSGGGGKSGTTKKATNTKSSSGDKSNAKKPEKKAEVKKTGGGVVFKPDTTKIKIDDFKDEKDDKDEKKKTAKKVLTPIGTGKPNENKNKNQKEGGEEQLDPNYKPNNNKDKDKDKDDLFDDSLFNSDLTQLSDKEVNKENNSSSDFTQLSDKDLFDSKKGNGSSIKPTSDNAIASELEGDENFPAPSKKPPERLPQIDNENDDENSL